MTKRNKLRKHGKNELADILANKINGIIAYNVRNQLSKLVDAPVHAMWDALHTQNNARKNNNRASHLLNDVEQVNAFLPANRMIRHIRLKMYRLTALIQRSVIFSLSSLMRSSLFFGGLLKLP